MPAMSTVKAITLDTYLKRTKKRVDTELLKILTKKLQPKKIPPNGFKASTIHSVLIGGKRIRPILAIASYEMCGGVDASIYTAACSLELIHAGSLMLDDLPCMDNADYRRGEPTTHKLYGEATTILASASLWVAAYELLSEIDNKQLPELIHKTSTAMGSRGLVQGQLLDLAAFNSTQDIKDLEECYRLKTGVLFALATSMGAILANAPENIVKALDIFGEKLGIAFQIRDDIIDTTQSFEESGKDAHLDSINNKPTYVSILGLEGAKNALQNTLDDCQAQLLLCGEKHTILSQLADSLQL
jgi:geranylgeranyl diphosphate synthase type II